MRPTLPTWYRTGIAGRVLRIRERRWRHWMMRYVRRMRKRRRRVRKAFMVMVRCPTWSGRKRTRAHVCSDRQGRDKVAKSGTLIGSEISPI